LLILELAVVGSIIGQLLDFDIASTELP